MAKSAPILIRLGQKGEERTLSLIEGQRRRSRAVRRRLRTNADWLFSSCAAGSPNGMAMQCRAVPIAHRKPKPNQNPTQPDPTNFASHILPYPAPLLPSLSRLSRWCHYFEASEKWGLFFIPHRQGYKGSTKYGFRSSWWRTCNWSRAIAIGYRTSRGVLTVLGGNITSFWSMIVLGFKL